MTEKVEYIVYSVKRPRVDRVREGKINQKGEKGRRAHDKREKVSALGPCRTELSSFVAGVFFFALFWGWMSHTRRAHCTHALFPPKVINSKRQ